MNFKYKFAEPDWDRWRRMDMVHLWEAAALVANVFPEEAYAEHIWYERQLSAFPAPFKYVWEAVNRDKDFGLLPSVNLSGRMLHRVDLRYFASWAAGKGFDLPKPLREKITHVETNALKQASGGQLGSGEASQAKAFSEPMSRPVQFELSKEKPHLLDSHIAAAIESAGSEQTALVFVHLREMALDGVPPFTGLVTDDGNLVYKNVDNKEKEYTKKALDSNLRRRRGNASD
jgi:hypothetical protein